MLPAPQRCVTMLAVPKKKPADEPDPKPVQVPFRVDDPRLVEALDRNAKRNRRSRNMTILVLLERGLTEDGDWPPK